MTSCSAGSAVRFGNYQRNVVFAAAAVAIRGKLAPIVGRVSMDLITVDITDIGDPAAVRGDFVDLIGPDLPLEAVGLSAKSIGYEVLTRLGARFHRHYVDRGD